MPFTSLGLAPVLQQAATAAGFATPTPVQTAAIPAMLSGRDLWLQSRTGSGKTAAFALPLLQAWLQGRPELPRPAEGLVLVPTRELAIQVGAVLRGVAHHLPGLAKVAVLFGGVSINPQLMGLRGGADLVVATPGRLLDVVRHNALSLQRVRTLVLDEADRLLSLGFGDELDQILALLPAQRQTVLCSATLAPAVQHLVQQGLHEPQHIRLAEVWTAPPGIVQRAISVDVGRRTALLKSLMQTGMPPDAASADATWLRPQQMLVFVATQYATEHVATKLQRAGLAAAPLHGALSQGARQRALEDFRAHRVQVLVATDMAARGLDIAGLPLVVNYDLARSAEDHIHRIGRTGRAGHSGLAISLVSAESEAHFRLLEKRQQLRLPREVLPGFEPAVPPAVPPAAALPEAATRPHPAGTGLDPNGGIKGRRPSKKDRLRAAAAAAMTGSR